MHAKYGALFTPWKIGSVEIKNRIVMSPMSGTSLFRWSELSGSGFNREAAKLFLDRADNHVGLIITGMAPVRELFWEKWLWQDTGVFEEIRPFMNEIHRMGAKLFVQLSAGMGRSFAINDMMLGLHKNRMAHALMRRMMDTDYQFTSPSPVPARWAQDVICPEMTVEQIRAILDALARTAALCRDAGVDGVEVHGVHGGYLLDQFAMSWFNKRTDEYGGSFENRYRFAVEAVQAIKHACGQDYPVSLRYSVESKAKGFGRGAIPGETYEEVGRSLEESERAARYLQEAGYDMLNADNGSADSWYWSHPPLYMPANCNLDSAAHIRRLVDIPVICAGRMDPETGASAVAEGRIDAVGFARQFLADPEWVTKLVENRLDEIRPCVGCHTGCLGFSSSKGHANTQDWTDAKEPARCAINPPAMQTRRYSITLAQSRKHIAIIGGGIAGMEAAILLARRGHHVDLYEKTGELGGLYIAASMLSFKAKDRELLTWYRREITKYPIRLHMHTEVMDIDALEANEIIVATGATPKRMAIPGVERAVEAVDYLLGRKTAGERVAIVGGGLTGCEMAYELYLKGKKPFIVEPMNDLICGKGISLANSSYLRDFFDAKEVPVYLEHSVREILDHGVVIAGKDGKSREVPADSVILCVGYQSAPLTMKGMHVHIVGDAQKVGNLRNAIWGVWDVCMRL